MKTAQKALVFAAFALVAGSVQASDVAIGDSLQDVLSAMGQPRGLIRSGSYLLLDYDRGKVELRDECVVKADLISEDDLIAYKALTARQQAVAHQADEARRARLFAEGTALRARKLADPDFLSAPASEQIAFWKSFRKTYPNVELGGEYAAALQTYEAELAAQQKDVRHAREVAELEARVAQAERDAAEAKAEADEARAYRYYASYPVCYVRPVPPCSTTAIPPQVAVPRPCNAVTWTMGSKALAPFPPAPAGGLMIGGLAWEK